ncbi:MAG: deoxyribonuclease V [Dehalococcoidales bacterium]|nr:deoxyribonuclease V [Dehalococcoidales bacterium]
MKVKKLHNWHLSIPKAIDLQQRLAAQVSRNSSCSTFQFVAGADISVGKSTGLATCAVVVLNYPELAVVETKIVQGMLDFPYIPGLLSFRESPLILEACSGLSITPELILVDGQGVAHPRRFGLASHLGLFLDIPTIGCAKSLLCGSHEIPDKATGSCTELMDKDEIIGMALRTKPGVKPVYVSIGHKINLQTAIHSVLKCCRGYRIPEPLRLAHLAAGGNLRAERYFALLESS